MTTIATTTPTIAISPTTPPTTPPINATLVFPEEETVVAGPSAESAGCAT
jgi:hypothetical protein